MKQQTLSEIRAAAASKGGKATAAKMTQEQRSERASKGGNAVLAKYGLSYYSHQLGGKPALA